MNSVRIVLISVGMFGRAYIEEMTRRDVGGEIVGIVEPSEEAIRRCPTIAEKGWPVFRTVEEFYAAHTADLAIIVSPIHLHTQMAIYCMQRGSHVLCEKPLCLTREDALRMADCSRKTGKFLAVGYQLNYNRDVLAMKKDILDGRFGKPLRLRVMHAYSRGAAYYARNNWAGHILVNGNEVFDSPFTNASAHNFQLMCFLLGPDMESACEVTGVEAELYRGNPNVENYDIAALRFATDVGAPLLYYTAHPHSVPEYGPVGVFEFEHATITYRPGQRYKAVMDNGEVIDYGVIPPTNWMQKIDDCIACVRDGTHPLCTVASDLSHIDAVRMVQQQPVTDVDPAHVDVVQLNNDTYWCVRDLIPTLEKAAEAWALPKEIGLSL